MKKHEHDILMIAAYRNLDNARADFGDLDRRAEKHAEMRSAVLAIKDSDGKPELIEAYNRHGGMAIGVGAGEHRDADRSGQQTEQQTDAGAVAGGLAASFADHELRTGLRHEVAEALEAGTAVIVAWVFPAGIEAVGTAFGNADSVKELPIDKQTIKTLDEAVAAAMAEAGHLEAGVTAGRLDTSS